MPAQAPGTLGQPLTPPLPPARRPKAAPCGFAWTSSACNLLQQLLFPSFVPPQSPQGCFLTDLPPSSSTAVSLSNGPGHRADLPVRHMPDALSNLSLPSHCFQWVKVTQVCLLPPRASGWERETLPASSPLNTHGMDLRIKRQQTLHGMLAAPAR